MEIVRYHHYQPVEDFIDAILGSMERLRAAVSKIGEEELVNCVLVQKGVRNAFLLQYIDYGERSPHGPISRQKLAGIRKYFPDLIQSKSAQGMIISKNKYSWEESHNEADMGRILGFPCRYDFDYIVSHPEKSSATIEIIVHFKPGGDKDKVQIMVYRCRDISHYPKAVAFAKEAEQALKNDLLVGPIIKSVEAKKTIRLGQTRRVKRTKSFRKPSTTRRRSQGSLPRQGSRRQRGDQARK